MPNNPVSGESSKRQVYSAMCQLPSVQVLSPYSGGVGDLMTMVEPALALATQDIEDSNLLSGKH